MIASAAILKAELNASRQAHEVTAQERDRFVVELGYLERWAGAAEAVLGKVRAIQAASHEGQADVVADLEEDLRLLKLPGPPPASSSAQASSIPPIEKLRRTLELALQRDEFRATDTAIVEAVERWLDALEKQVVLNFEVV